MLPNEEIVGSRRFSVTMIPGVLGLMSVPGLVRDWIWTYAWFRPVPLILGPTGQRSPIPSL